MPLENFPASIDIPPRMFCFGKSGSTERGLVEGSPGELAIVVVFFFKKNLNASNLPIMCLHCQLLTLAFVIMTLVRYIK